MALLPWKKILDDLEEDDLSGLAELDSAGLIPAREESFSEYKDRLLRLSKAVEELDDELRKAGKAEIVPGFFLDCDGRIPPGIMREACEVTGRAYAFCNDWVPGFFLSRGLGPLWGGCACYSPENSLAIFLIRKSFALKRRWFIYDRRELLSHELCHAARMPLKDRTFEEHFAYRLSSSALRRRFGSCFQSKADSIFFLLPVFLLLLVQIFNTSGLTGLPVFPFWILAAAYPAFMIFRNMRYSSVYGKAKRALLELDASIPADCVLFRCVRDEISYMAACRGNPEALVRYIGEKSSSELRWKIISSRFINNVGIGIVSGDETLKTTSIPQHVG